MLPNSNYFWHDIATHSYSISPQHERDSDMAVYILVVYLVHSCHCEQHCMARPHGHHRANLVRYLCVLMVTSPEILNLTANNPANKLWTGSTFGVISSTVAINRRVNMITTSRSLITEVSLCVHDVHH